MITKREAQDIATKLDATVNSGRHLKVAIEFDGKIVRRFGIRHSKKVPNSHIPSALGLSLSRHAKPCALPVVQAVVLRQVTEGISDSGRPQSDVRSFHGSRFPSRPRASNAICMMVSSCRTF